MKYLIIILLSLVLTADAQVDKQLHFYAGATVAGWGSLTVDQTTLWKPAVAGITWAALTGAGKEVADMVGFGTPEWKDFGATVIGGIVSVGIITGIKVIIRHKKHKR